MNCKRKREDWSSMKKLRVLHFPQIQCDPFIIDVESLLEARLICNTLANYDLFQYEQNIKPDYANMTVVEEYDEEEKEWTSWMDEETGIDDIEEYFDHLETV